MIKMSVSCTMKQICIAILTLPLLTQAFIASASQRAIEITPNEAFIGEPVNILLQGFPKNIPVTLEVRETNSYGHILESQAIFLTDRRGRADLSKRQPLSGSYRNRDPFGLFWSMSESTNVVEAQHRAPFEPLLLQFTASVHGQTVAQSEFTQLLLAPGVQRIPVHNGRLRGALFVPPGKSPHPAVIILGGSEGGLGQMVELTASYLASKDYAALALAYFSYDDLPKNLRNISLEYFGDSIHWLQSQPEIRPDKIAVFGVSRGGELALLLGSTFPQIKAVIAMSPSGVIWPGLGSNENDPVPAWTYGGKFLPFMNHKWTPEQISQLQKADQEHLNVGFLWCQIQLSDTSLVERASIAVDKINGPVLLVSGNDDQLWPSTELSDMVMARLNRLKHPFPDCHLAYAGVGHFIPLPTLPATIHSFAKEQLGGDSEPTAAAALDAWTRITNFLNDNLKE
jgi:dienelactone hydrolase